MENKTQTKDILILYCEFHSRLRHPKAKKKRKERQLKRECKQKKKKNQMPASQPTNQPWQINQHTNTQTQVNYIEKKLAKKCYIYPGEIEMQKKSNEEKGKLCDLLEIKAECSSYIGQRIRK